MIRWIHPRHLDLEPSWILEWFNNSNHNNNSNNKSLKSSDRKFRVSDSDPEPEIRFETNDESDRRRQHRGKKGDLVDMLTKCLSVFRC